MHRPARRLGRDFGVLWAQFALAATSALLAMLVVRRGRRDRR